MLSAVKIENSNEKIDIFNIFVPTLIVSARVPKMYIFRYIPANPIFFIYINKVYPCKSQFFFYIKVGFMGYTLQGLCYLGGLFNFI